MQTLEQLADAPTWGEWADATVEAHRSGAYDVEFEDGSSELHTRSDLQYMLKRPPVENNVKRFRRLNYEPKPAREVEEKSFYIIRWANRIRDFICVAAVKEKLVNADEITSRWLQDYSRKYICKRYLATSEHEAISTAIREWKSEPSVLAPQPAREVERTYEGLTAREWADGSGGPVASGLARDLLAAQAELRELKGEK